MSEVKLLLLLALILSIGLLIYSSSHYEDGFQLIQFTSSNGEKLKLVQLTLGSKDEYFCSWSPGSSKILYSYKNQLWIIDIKTKKRIQLTKTGTNFCGEFSLDGKKIAFVSVNGESSNICVMDYDTKSIKCFPGRGKNLSPQWNPDGSKIAFVRIENDGRHIWVMDADGSNQTPLTHDLGNIECGGFRWSPDGSKIAFSTFVFRNNTSEEWSIWVMDADGSDKKKIADGLFPEWISENEVAWITNKGDLWRMNTDGSDKKLLAHNVFLGCSISPNGIAYFDTKGELWIINGKKVKIILSDYNMFPSWDPSGKRIAFMSAKSGNVDIWLISWERESGKAEFVNLSEKASGGR